MNHAERRAEKRSTDPTIQTRRAEYMLQRPKQEVRINFPWPPGQMGTSNIEIRSRADVIGCLHNFRAELFNAKLPFDDFVWCVRKNPAGKLWLWMFHADFVPFSSRDPWVFRKISEDPPEDDKWEVKFVQLARAIDALPGNTAQ